MTSGSARRERLRAVEAQLIAALPADEVAHRLEGIRRDIEMALEDIESVLRKARAARDDEQPDGC
jgi:hypothetical protein